MTSASEKAAMVTLVEQPVSAVIWGFKTGKA